MCVRACGFVCTCVFLRVRVHLFACASAYDFCKHAYVVNLMHLVWWMQRSRSNQCQRMPAGTHARMRVHVHVHVHVCIYICVCMHMHLHAVEGSMSAGRVGTLPCALLFRASGCHGVCRGVCAETCVCRGVWLPWSVAAMECVEARVCRARKALFKAQCGV